MQSSRINGDPVALSEEEKRRIVAEIAFREQIARELKAGDQPAQRAGIVTTLNSPFFITIVGGIILALLGALFQHHYTQVEDEQAYRRAVTDRQRELLKSLATDLDTQIRAGAWLNNEQRRIASMSATSPSSAILQEHQRGFQEVLDIFIKTPQASTYADQVKALFTSAHVHDAMDRLIRDLGAGVAEAGRQIGKLPGNEDGLQLYTQVIYGAIATSRLQLFQAMEDEIRSAAQK